MLNKFLSCFLGSGQTGWTGMFDSERMSISETEESANGIYMYITMLLFMESLTSTSHNFSPSA